MKVLHVIPSLDRAAGGPVFALEAMLQTQHQGGIHVRVLATGEKSAGSADLMPKGMQSADLCVVAPVYTPLKWSPRLAKAVRVAVSDVDVVHCHGVWEQCQHEAAAAARSRGIPCIFTPHGMLSPWSLSQSRWRKRLYRVLRLNRMMRRCSGLHFTTPMELAAAEGIYPAVPRFVIPLNVGAPAILPARGRFRERLGLNAVDGLVVFLGRVHPGKGLEYLIPAMAESGLRNAQLAVIGPESEGYGQAIRHLAERCGVSARVHETGPLMGDEKWQALVDADVLALPSDHENFGMVVIEALAAGTPVVVSSSTGVASMIAGNAAVRVTERSPGDVSAAASQFIGLEPAAREAVSRQAISLVEDAFSATSVARQWRETYDRLLGRAGTR